MPPSIVSILLAYPSIASEYASSHLTKKKLMESHMIKRNY